MEDAAPDLTLWGPGSINNGTDSEEQTMAQKKRRGSPGDQTGRRQATLEAEVVEDQKKQDELTMISRQQEEAAKEEIIDYTDEDKKVGQKPKSRTQEDDKAEAEVVQDGGESFDLNAKIAELRESGDPALQALAEDYDRMRRQQDAQVIKQGEVTAGQTTRDIRTAFDINQMTLGVGTEYNFKAGQWYRVPVHVAQHLEEKDLLMH